MPATAIAATTSCANSDQQFLDNDDVAPLTVKPGVLVVGPNFAKPQSGKQFAARHVFRKHPRYQLPPAARPHFIEKRRECECAKSLAAGLPLSAVIGRAAIMDAPASMAIVGTSANIRYPNRMPQISVV